MERTRPVVVPAKGNGGCPDAKDENRLQYEQCNAKACPAKVQCQAKLDLLILLDGSGSVGSTGWAKVKTFAEKLAGAFQTGPDLAQVGTLLFSGPKNWKKLRTCVRGEAADFAAECGVKWISHLTQDVAKVKTDLQAAAWPKATTLTSAALSMAASELTNGRQGAQSVVVVITDGKPMYKSRTVDAAASLRQKARLMWVPVGRRVPVDFIKTLASEPIADNVLVANKFTLLDKQETLDKVVADVCPKITQ